MRLVMPPTRIRRVLSFSALAVVLSITSLTLTQCRSVADRMTGVQPLANRPSDCVDRCRDIYRISLLIENAVHKLKTKLCNGNATCIAIEDARHAAALAKIEQNRIECLADCHNQGGS